MQHAYSFIPANSLSLEALAELYTRAFDDYFYPASVTAAELAARVPAEQLLLDRSPLLCVDGEPVGLALLGQRGERACCGGFGIVPAQRGRGLALPLTLALLERAQQNGAREMRLIVLAQNERAIKIYRRAGFTIWRELWCYEWDNSRSVARASTSVNTFQIRANRGFYREDAKTRRALEGYKISVPSCLRGYLKGIAASAKLESVPVDELLALGPEWQPVAPIWSREPDALRALGGLSGLALVEGGAQIDYVVLRHLPDRTVDILALGVRTAEDAVRLLGVLQRQYKRITCQNEPTGSPAARALQALGFTRAFRRFEMVIRL